MVVEERLHYLCLCHASDVITIKALHPSMTFTFHEEHQEIGIKSQRIPRTIKQS